VRDNLLWSNGLFEYNQWLAEKRACLKGMKTKRQKEQQYRKRRQPMTNGLEKGIQKNCGGEIETDDLCYLFDKGVHALRYTHWIIYENAGSCCN
jgi:hypothetical protein